MSPNRARRRTAPKLTAEIGDVVDRVVGKTDTLYLDLAMPAKIQWVMSVFLSWSGKDTPSYRVALVFQEFIPKVIQKTECYISAENQAGTMWVEAVFKELDRGNIGLVFVTRDNSREPVAKFRSGSNSKKGRGRRIENVPRID